MAAAGKEPEVTIPEEHWPWSPPKGRWGWWASPEMGCRGAEVPGPSEDVASCRAPPGGEAPEQGERLRFALSFLELGRPWLRSHEDQRSWPLTTVPAAPQEWTDACGRGSVGSGSEGAEVLRALLLCVEGPGVRCFVRGGRAGSGHQARDGPPQCSLPRGGTALLFSQEKPAQRPTHALTWSAVEQKSDLPVPRPLDSAPPQLSRAWPVCGLHVLGLREARGRLRPCSVCGPGRGFPREAEEVPLAERPPSTTKPPVR